jgi:hypothetical protein
MSSAQIVSATSNMHSRMVAPPVSYGGFWQHPGLGGQTNTQDVKPFAQSPFLHGDKTPTSLGKSQEIKYIVKMLFPHRESLVSDIPAGNGNVGSLFFTL